MNRLARGLLVWFLLVAPMAAHAPGPAAAVEPHERLADPVLEGRAREISKTLRCLVCQNQSIDDSNAELAGDLRRLVRERLLAGDSDGAVRDYLVDRYGDFVLLDPPFKPATYALWIGPGLILLFAASGVAWYFRRPRPSVAAAPPLTEAERKRLAAVLGDAEPR